MFLLFCFFPSPSNDDRQLANSSRAKEIRANGQQGHPRKDTTATASTPDGLDDFAVPAKTGLTAAGGEGQRKHHRSSSVPNANRRSRSRNNKESSPSSHSQSSRSSSGGKVLSPTPSTSSSKRRPGSVGRNTGGAGGGGGGGKHHRRRSSGVHGNVANVNGNGKTKSIFVSPSVHADSSDSGVSGSERRRRNSSRGRTHSPQGKRNSRGRSSRKDGGGGTALASPTEAGTRASNALAGTTSTTTAIAATVGTAKPSSTEDEAAAAAAAQGDPNRVDIVPRRMEPTPVSPAGGKDGKRRSFRASKKVSSFFCFIFVEKSILGSTIYQVGTYWSLVT